MNKQRIRELQTAAEQAIRQVCADRVLNARDDWDVVVDKDPTGAPGEVVVRFRRPGKSTLDYRLDKEKSRWILSQAD